MTTMSEIELTGSLVKKNLSETKSLIQQLSVQQFSQPLSVLSGCSIGQHFRHLIEFYVCMFYHIESGIISYDERERDARIENDPEFAMLCIETIISNINALKEDKRLHIRLNLSPEEEKPVVVETSLCRELAYNFEHGIHHLAVIKIGLLQFPEITVDDNFGIAPSTIRHKNTSVKA